MRLRSGVAVAVAPIHTLSWELLYATGVAIKRKTGEKNHKCLAWVTPLAWIQPLARELPYAMGVAKKEKKKKKRFKKDIVCLLGDPKRLHTVTKSFGKSQIKDVVFLPPFR